MPVSSIVYFGTLRDGGRMNEKEALVYYKPYIRKHNKLLEEMTRGEELFLKHVNENIEYYKENNYVWSSDNEDSLGVPIKPHMPLKLIGYMQRFIFGGDPFPSIKLKIKNKPHRKKWYKRSR